MKLLSKLLVFLTLFTAISPCEGLRPTRRNRGRVSSVTSCPVPRIKNGTVRLQRAGRMVNFFCAPGFDIHGSILIACNAGRWRQEMPICIKSGCVPPPKRPNGFVMLDEKRQKSMLFCDNGYVVAGVSISYCDGEQWDRELGVCRKDDGNTKVCDFETANLCGWTQDSDNDFQWKQKNGWVSYEKLEYGPKHDHTKEKPLEGHYMIAEGTNSRSSQRSRLLSPVYKKSDSYNACFRFFYHMYGKAVGRLRVIIKTIDDEMDEVVENPQNILFEIEHSQGNLWREAHLTIEPMKADFQIIFEATGGKGVISDIAIDDVALMKEGECYDSKQPTLQTTTEAGGIFDTQSCENRCMETESVRENSSDFYFKDGHLIEKCDCHQECIDLNTCCFDYISKCVESQSTDVDVMTTPFEEIITETSPVVDEVTVSIINTMPIQTTVPTSSSTSTTQTSTSKLSNRTTTEASTIGTSISLTSIRMPNTTATFMKSTEKITKSADITKTTPNTTTWATKSSKMTSSTIKITGIPETLFPKSRRIAYPTVSVRIQPAIKPFDGQKISRRVTSSSYFQSITSTSTDATLKAMLMPSVQQHTIFAWISIVILISIISMLMLVTWKYFSAQKWNKFNGHHVEYKSNYHSDNEEALVRSDSFIIDDSYNETLIEKVPDDKCNSGENKSEPTPKKVSTDKIKVVPNITKKLSERLTRKCGQYSDKRYLTVDDEQFDFSLQMN